MKKVVALFTIAMCFTAGSVMAQGGGGGQTPEQRTAMMKERLKDVGLSAAHMDSVIAVYGDRSYMQGVNFRELADDARTAKMKEISDLRTKRLEKAGVPAEQLKKVVDIMSQRPGGGRPGGGGGGRK